jgi:hypothetical protein
MQRLYSFIEGTQRVFCIYTPEGRNFKCHSVIDPDLYLPAEFANSLGHKNVPPESATLMLEAPHITLELIKSTHPELLI